MSQIDANDLVRSQLYQLLEAYLKMWGFEIYGYWADEEKSAWGWKKNAGHLHTGFEEYHWALFSALNYHYLHDIR